MEKDALSKFDFSTVTGSGLFLKFKADSPVTIRVLTTDPVVSNNTFTDPKTGEETLTTRFSFVIYNWTDERAQILSVSPTMAKKISEIHVDPDFGANIKKIDLKITPTGERLQRKYDIQVLPQARDLSNEQIQECKAINLEEKVEGGYRMSVYDPKNYKPTKKDADSFREEFGTTTEEHMDDPIDLNDIPF